MWSFQFTGEGLRIACDVIVEVIRTAKAGSFLSGTGRWNLFPPPDPPLEWAGVEE
jgi:hypothetical protein